MKVYRVRGLPVDLYIFTSERSDPGRVVLVYDRSNKRFYNTSREVQLLTGEERMEILKELDEFIVNELLEVAVRKGVKRNETRP